MTNPTIATDLERRLAHQSRWMRLCASLYWTATAGAVAAGGTAVLLGALRHAVPAAIAAFAATIMTAIERALRIGDRWAFHRFYETEFSLLKTRYDAGAIDDGDALVERDRIARGYAADFRFGTQRQEKLEGQTPE